eukprot:TRINITY_DN5075_c0_g1_i1.p1 TRINITY_DN5075_c0_g1~~TRINITY_DN5075_c0_g1_i1.p1  ORF type:complete len:324 (+),score=25.44 TRINITY_DN5075_c0_g1_i1:1-972(+)
MNFVGWDFLSFSVVLLLFVYRVFQMASVQQQVDKLSKRVEEGQYYEAQQMFKTIHHRYKAKRKLQESYDILYEGAKLQLKHGQFTCGGELGSMLVEAYSSDGQEADQQSVGKITSIIESFPTPSTNNGIEVDWQCAVDMAQQLTVEAVKWAQGFNSPYISRLYLLFANYAMKCLGWKGLGTASLYFAKSNQMQPFAQGIKEGMAQTSNPKEQQFFITRGVLQVLAVGTPETTNLKIEHAEELVRYLKPLPDQPLVHFVEILLMTLKSKAIPTYERLKEVYNGLLAKDDSFQQYLGRIETVYLGLNKQGAGLGGMLGDFLKMLQ